MAGIGLALSACGTLGTGRSGGKVKLMTLDPGHFHAALVQKFMYEDVEPKVWVYAPEGPDVQDHLSRIQGFNTRAEKPTRWEEKVSTGPGFLERMLKEKPGNVVVISGNNAKKARYILDCVEAGLHVLAYEDGVDPHPAPARVQRIAALRPPFDPERALLAG